MTLAKIGSKHLFSLGQIFWFIKNLFVCDYNCICQNIRDVLGPSLISDLALEISQHVLAARVENHRKQIGS